MELVIPPTASSKSNRQLGRASPGSTPAARTLTLSLKGRPATSVASARSSFVATTQPASAPSINPSRSLSEPSLQEPGLKLSCSGTLAGSAGSEPPFFSVRSSNVSPSPSSGSQPGSSASVRPSRSSSTPSKHKRAGRPNEMSVASKR